MQETTLLVSELQRFCMHDGPGIRTTVFLKGCPLRCAWCHNPETQESRPELLYYETKCIGCGACAATCPNGVHLFREDAHALLRNSCVGCGACANICPTRALEIAGTPYSIAELIRECEKDNAFYGSGGGVTLSGGEPFFQKERSIALLRALKENGFHTAAETCGYFDPVLLPDAARYTDLFLFDLKDTDEERHKAYVGAPIAPILSNLRALDSLGAKTRLRCILVNGVNASAEHYRRVSEIAQSLSHCEGVEILPYHAYGGSKSTFLGKEDNGRTDWIPSREQLDEFRAVLTQAGIHTFARK